MEELVSVRRSDSGDGVDIGKGVMWKVRRNGAGVLMVGLACSL